MSCPCQRLEGVLRRIHVPECLCGQAHMACAHASCLALTMSPLLAQPLGLGLLQGWGVLLLLLPVC